MIDIIRMVNVVDNWGDTESTRDVDEIESAIKNKEWDDDTWLVDTFENRYSVWDLVDTEIKVGNNIILVKD